MEAQAKKWFSYNIENVNRKYFKFLKESYNWSELNETIFILNRITIEDGDVKMLLIMVWKCVSVGKNFVYVV